MLKLLIGAAIGAAAAWFPRPDDGRADATSSATERRSTPARARIRPPRRRSYAGGAIKGKATSAGTRHGP